MIDPDKLPDIRPDRRRFWLLRGLSWVLFLAGLGAFAIATMHGTLAYYATKNGAEVTRVFGPATAALVAMVMGLLMMGVSQVFRVVLAIEENTRMIAYHTRPRARSFDEARTRSVPAQPVERMRV